MTKFILLACACVGLLALADGVLGLDQLFTAPGLEGHESLQDIGAYLIMAKTLGGATVTALATGFYAVIEAMEEFRRRHPGIEPPKRKPFTRAR